METVTMNCLRRHVLRCNDVTFIVVSAIRRNRTQLNCISVVFSHYLLYLIIIMCSKNKMLQIFVLRGRVARFYRSKRQHAPYWTGRQYYITPCISCILCIIVFFSVCPNIQPERLTLVLLT